MNNIGYKLFLNVEKFNGHWSIHGIHNSPTVKQFWTVGYRLFKSKFIRFMGGLKFHGPKDISQ